jgi:multidrug efflux pump subunit AcrB
LKEKLHISPFTVIVAFVAVSLVGLAVIPYLTVKLSPSRTLPSLTVSFNMPGNSARIVEMEATSKLEAMLARINGVKSINSTSGNNYGEITLGLDKHASMDVARFEASTIIRQTWPSLPPSANYPTITVDRPDEESARPFIVYSIDAAVSPIIIQQYAEERIKPILAQLPGIYRIDVSGSTPMEWMLEYDISQLDALGITVNNIMDAINSYNRKEALGMALTENEDSGRRYMRLSLTAGGGDVKKGFHAEDIFLSDREGRMIRLDQLVAVTYREQPPTSYYRINGLNSIYMSLTATENANQLRLSSSVREEMVRIKNGLPKGYEIHNSYDATEHINTELNKIYIRTVFTVLILLLFVFLTTFNARYLLLIILSLFFNITIGFIFYYMAGLEIQIYSLAGITISLSLVIDNTIIMADHYLRNRNRNVFISILAATLTTVGALAMIYFLDENIRLNLQDFASVVMINLIVSLAVSLFFIPASIEKMKITKRPPVRLKMFRSRLSPKKIVLGFNRFYFKMIRFLLRFRPVALTLMALAFGLPVNLIPEKIDGKEKWVERYNSFMTSHTFKEKVRPVIESALGGTLRLFAQKVSDGGYYNRSDETVLGIYATMPNGTTIRQINHLIRQMESYLSRFKEIKQFQTSISSPLRASIQVYFTKEAESSAFPYQLKSNVISKALQLGGGSWGVYGLQDQGFSNDVRDMAGNMRVNLYGYNYDDLYVYADTLRDRLLTYRRIKDVFINSRFSSYKDDYREFVFSLNRERMATEDIRPYELYASINPVFARNLNCGYVNGEDRIENIKMSSKQSRLYDIWSLANMSRSMNGKYYKTGELATIEITQTPKTIVKENQQYVLCLQYEYIGSSQQGSKKLEQELEEFNANMPLGYSAEGRSGYSYWFNRKNAKQYLFLGLIIMIIFFMTSILFNSLKKPLAIIFVIPVSYIGVFLTFYLFKLNFDQGGFASFVLLCGITVNASIYLISEYNRILKLKPDMNPIKAYIKSWNIKIVPIFLTIISTMLGFIPFMVGLSRESFWFPFAAGTIGGLIMSLAGIFFFLPLFVIKRKYFKTVEN